MPAKKKSSKKKASPKRSSAKKKAAKKTMRKAASTPESCADVLRWLEKKGTQRAIDDMARYAIPSDHAFGVPVGELRKLAKQLGRDHALAQELWATGRYEARMLAAMIDEPDAVTSTQMDAWCREFDSWSICDTVCFHLFDRCEPALAKVDKWSKRKGEFQRRAGFALLACLALHDKQLEEEAFLERLPAIEAGAMDERNFVKKAVSWALRSMGERSKELHRQCLKLAKRLSASNHPSERWVGKDALRGLESPAAKARLKRRS